MHNYKNPVTKSSTYYWYQEHDFDLPFNLLSKHCKNIQEDLNFQASITRSRVRSLSQKKGNKFTIKTNACGHDTCYHTCFGVDSLFLT